jgi:hypothetical protein
MNNIFIVKKEQLGGSDVNEFLREAIDREFSGKDYMIASETIVDTITHYSATPRKIKGFAISAAGRSHTIYFDIQRL